MLGSKGPSVTVQTPSSPLASFGGAVVPSQSPVSVTSDALGARMRNVTFRSGSTSGETTRCCAYKERATKARQASFIGLTVYCACMRRLAYAALNPRAKPSRPVGRFAHIVWKGNPRTLKRVSSCRVHRGSTAALFGGGSRGLLKSVHREPRP